MHFSSHVRDPRQRARRLVGAVAATVALLLMTACAPDGSGDGTDGVAVSGTFGSVPVVTFAPPLPLQEERVDVIIEGDGRKLVEGEPVLMTLTAYDGQDGELIEDRPVGEAQTRMLTEEDAGPELVNLLSGHREGSRLLVRQPVAADGENRMLVLVIDLRYTRARGEEVAVPAGLPTVTLGEDGSPTITLGEGAPPSSPVVQPLVHGTGAQVRPGQDVTVQYTGVSWESGEPYDSTWAAGKVPKTLAIDTTLPGLRAGLVDQTVGSQILLVIPPDLAHGTETLVLVVDILAASGGDEDSVVSSPNGQD
ncbi:MAG: FKBP-type peptidyl-prolyl cis-trans isomerase [Georgenia sp.]